MPGNMKNLIADTFTTLMMKKDIDKITVKDLYKEARPAACADAHEPIRYPRIRIKASQ